MKALNLREGFAKGAGIINLEEYREAQPVKAVPFSEEDAHILARLDNYAATLRIAKPMTFEETNESESANDTGRTACFYLAPSPYAPWFRITKEQKGNQPETYKLREGYFKEPRRFTDLSQLAMVVSRAMKARKEQLNEEMNALIYGKPKTLANS